MMIADSILVELLEAENRMLPRQVNGSLLKGNVPQLLMLLLLLMQRPNIQELVFVDFLTYFS